MYDQKTSMHVVNYIIILTVISLLAIFYLEDIGLNRFKKIVSSQNTSKMFKVCNEQVDWVMVMSFSIF